MLLLLDGSTDWERLRESIPRDIQKVIVAADHAQDLVGANEHGLIPLILNKRRLAVARTIATRSSRSGRR